jgi:hypothetical protein
MTGTELEDLPPAPKRPLLRDIALWPVLQAEERTLVLRAAIAQLDDGADAVHHVGSGCRCVWWGKHINPICVTVAPCERVTW